MDGRTDGRMDGRTDGQTENIYSIFRDKLLLLGEHVFGPKASQNISQRRFLPKLKVFDSYHLGVRNNSFHQPQFDPNSS